MQLKYYNSTWDVHWYQRHPLSASGHWLRQIDAKTEVGLWEESVADNHEWHNNYNAFLQTCRDRGQVVLVYVWRVATQTFSVVPLNAHFDGFEDYPMKLM